MEKILIIVFIAFTLPAFSQMNLPDLSPQGQVSQTVGYTNITVRYGRPAARGRKVFGELVPYGKLWRTGAGKGTTIQFDQPVKIGEYIIQAGNYALVSIPDRERWTILLNTDTSKIYGDPSEYDSKTEIAKILINPVTTKRFYESLTFDLDIIKNNGELYLSWENTQVHFSIITNSNEKALEEINQTLARNPNDTDNLSFAAYYLSLNQYDLGPLISYVDRALKIKEDWWYYQLKIDLLVKQKKWDEATAIAHQAIDFMTRTKSAYWESNVQHFKEEMSFWKKD